MVSTRQHPREFPAPDTSPIKASARKSSRLSTASPSADTSPTRISSSEVKSVTRRVVSVPVPARESESVSEDEKPLNIERMRAPDQKFTSDAQPKPSSRGWTHTASNVTIAWVLISLPLTIWDTLYVLLRPHTMIGGRLQWPIWKPYEIYAAVDHLYGMEGWNRNDGFAGAQGCLNLIECILYGLYIMIVLEHGRPSKGGKGLQVGEGVRGWVAGGRRVAGKNGNRALLIGFAAAVMTLSKTVLYMLNEYFSDFENIGHNSWPTLFALYFGMNGLWILFPAYMTIVFGSDILEGLDLIAVEEPSAAGKKYY